MTAKTQWLIAGALLALMAALALANLGNRFMWIDESITAMLGKNVLRFGYPRAWDGVNLVTATNGNDFNAGLTFIKDNWLPHYLAALGLLTGSSSFNLRLPFAIIGIGGAAALYLLALRRTRSVRTALLALGLYALSVPVLLYLRQVRYYAPGLAFVILTHLLYVECARRPSRGLWAAFAVSAILLFHSMYMFFFITIANVGLAYILFDRGRRTWPHFACAMAGIAAGTLPWFVYAQAFTGSVETTAFLGLGWFWAQAQGYLWQVQAYFFPFITLGVIWAFVALCVRPQGRGAPRHARGPDGMPLWSASRDPAQVAAARQEEAAARARRVEAWRDLWLDLAQIGLTVVVISLFSNYFCTRYLLPCLPACYLLTARAVAAIGRRDRLFAAAVTALLVFTNGLGVAPYLAVKYSGLDPARVEGAVKPPLPFFKTGWNWPFAYTLADYLDGQCRLRSYAMDYLGEVAHDYDDANEGMVRFLWNYAQPGDTVFVYGPDYETVAYYTGLPVVNRLDPAWRPWPLVYDEFPNAARFAGLTARPIGLVDWVVARPIYYSEEERLAGVAWENEALFERIHVDYPDAPPTPEIWYHSFTTDRGYPGFYVFRNRLTTAPLGTAAVGPEELAPSRGGG